MIGLIYSIRCEEPENTSPKTGAIFQRTKDGGILILFTIWKYLKKFP